VAGCGDKRCSSSGHQSSSVKVVFSMFIFCFANFSIDSCTPRVKHFVF